MQGRWVEKLYEQLAMLLYLRRTGSNDDALFGRVRAGCHEPASLALYDFDHAQSTCAAWLELFVSAERWNVCSSLPGHFEQARALFCLNGFAVNRQSDSSHLRLL